jgi:hypothetical protein
VYAIYHGNKKSRLIQFEEFCPPPRLNGCISIYCNFSLAPGFSPVGVVGPTASRFNGLVTAARKTVETVPIFSIRYSPG